MTVPTWNNPYEFDLLMLEPVHEMMATGIRIDQEVKAELQQKAVDEWKTDQESLNKVAGFDLNVDSSKQCCDLLYKDLGLPKRFKKKKLTSDEAALRSLMAECRYRVDELKTTEARTRWMQGALICYYTLRVRGIRKQISSFLGLSVEKGVLSGETTFEDLDGRIRGTISVGGTETARFSHSKTLWDTGINLATNPRKLRRMYIPDDGYEMAEFDLNRGESWIYAHLSQDPELLRIHTNGDDFHAETASAISVAFGEPLEVSWIIEHKEGGAYKIRYLGKRINHASSYRMGPFKGAEVINGEAEDTGITVTVSEFRKAQDLWKQKYFMVEQWWKEIESELDKTRTLQTPYGRVHQFHDKWGESLFKSATAYVPQSTSVDYLNRGFLRTYHRYQKPGAWGLKILAQTHDSILVQYRIADRAEAIPAIVEALTDSLIIKGRQFSIPIEPNAGPSWGELRSV